MFRPLGSIPFLVFISASSSILVGCGSDDSTVPGPVAGLDGSWTSGCLEDAEENESELNTLQVSGNSMTYGARLFSDQTCMQKNREITGSTTFTSPGAIELATGGMATQIDIAIDSIALAINEENIVQAYNDRAICGRSDWQINVSYDITNCKNFGGAEISYDIVAIIDNVLYFGDGPGDGNTPATRPTTLDFDSPFTRINN